MSTESRPHRRTPNMTPTMTPVRSRSRSKSQTRLSRPSLAGSRRNSVKSFISLSIDNDENEFPYSSPISPFLHATTPSASSQASSFPALDSLQSTPSSLSLDKFEIPSINANVDHTLPLEYFKQDLLSIVQQLGITKWHRLPNHVANDIQIKRISGALTNAIFRVDPPPLQVLKNLDLHHWVYPTLLLRVYGPNVETIIDREYELKMLMRLSRQNIGPRLFGCFGNGRVEQYLDNAITLTKADIMNKKTSARIARRMRQLHNGIRLSSRERKGGPVVWKNIDKWCTLVEEILEKQSDKQQEIDLFKMEFSKFKKVIAKYKAWLSSQYETEATLNESLVFCHNDTQYGNLLFTTPKTHRFQQEQQQPSTSETILTNLTNLSLENLQGIKPSNFEKHQDQNLVVIDFEYSGANPPAYDIANHFCEWMQNYNHATKPYAIWEEDFPKLNEQLNLIYSYLIYQNFEYSQDLSKLERKAKILYNECIYWRGAVSLNWALWAILQNGDKKREEEESQYQESELLGPNGEVYNIIPHSKKKGEDDENAIVDDDKSDSDVSLLEAEEIEGSSDVDTFDYIKYAMDKLKLFLGDMTQLGLIDKSEMVDTDLKYLSCKFYDV